MKHVNLNDEFRNKLLESAAWGKIGLNINEGKVEEGQESLTEETDAQGYEIIQDQEEEYIDEGSAHVCPLCTSLLPEAIEEERVLEHLEIIANVLDRITQVNESEEDLESVIAECVREVLLESDDDIIDEDEDISEEEYEQEDSDDDDVVEEEMDKGYMSSSKAGKGKMGKMMKGKKSKKSC